MPEPITDPPFELTPDEVYAVADALSFFIDDRKGTQMDPDDIWVTNTCEALLDAMFAYMDEDDARHGWTDLPDDEETPAPAKPKATTAPAKKVTSIVKPPEPLPPRKPQRALEALA